LTLIDGIAYIGDYEGCSELPLWILWNKLYIYVNGGAWYQNNKIKLKRASLRNKSRSLAIRKWENDFKITVQKILFQEEKVKKDYKFWFHRLHFFLLFLKVYSLSYLKKDKIIFIDRFVNLNSLFKAKYNNVWIEDRGVGW
jgi:hypothetical protein